MNRESISLLEKKFNILIDKIVSYSPTKFLPEMDYLKTQEGVWYGYSISIPVPHLKDEDEFYWWVMKEFVADEYTYVLGEAVTDENLLSKLEWK